MNRTMGIPTTVVGAFLILSVAGCASTPAITDGRGKAIDGSIAELVPVEIGGMEQWVLIRGSDRSNPVLLWLHGGAGRALCGGPLGPAGIGQIQSS